MIKNCSKDGAMLSLFATFALYYFGACLTYLFSGDFVNYHVMAVGSLEANHGSDFKSFCWVSNNSKGLAVQRGSLVSRVP